MQKKYMVPALALATITRTFGIIKEIKTIDEARAYACEKAHTIVCFDVDNTLLEPKNSSVGSAQWITTLAQYAAKSGIAPHSTEWNQLVHVGIQLFANAHHDQAIEFVSVENETIKLVAELQSKGIPTMVLTARPYSWWQDTARELQKAGFNFSLSIFGQTHIYLDLPRDKALLSSGMLMAGPINSKAAVLERFLDIINYLPQRIVCIDDELKPLKELESLFTTKPEIEFIGLRYGFLDEKVRSFTLQDNMIPQAFKDFVSRAAKAH